MGYEKILDRQLPDLPKNICFCKRCVISNQRPRIQFDANGVCFACLYADLKARTDWTLREKELRELCDQHRRTDGRFDVIVPGSGGKDSARVTHELKHKYGMHPLSVTWVPFSYTPIGFENFQKFIMTGGFTNLMAWPNGNLHRKLARLSLEAVGDVFLPFIFGQMSYAFHIAKQFDIKLVFFGENGEAEYTGNPAVFHLRGMPVERWAEQYFKGVTVDDLIQYGLSETDSIRREDFMDCDLTFYRPPNPEEMKKQGIEFHWYSYYNKWVPQENYYYAAEHTGLMANPAGHSEGTYSKYASLDDKLDGLHYYFGFIKFGMGRATSDAAHEVRDRHISREEAAALVKRYDGEFPAQWFHDSLEYLQMTEEQFWKVVDRFRQPHIWEKRTNWRLRKAVYDEYSFSNDPPGYISSLLGGL
jgi:N-acetyl sugar amidotransferase